MVNASLSFSSLLRADPTPISDKQHIALVLGMGGLTPCPDVVDAVLAPVDGEEKKILDIGNYSIRFAFLIY